MTSAARKLIEEAVKLPKEEREELVEALSDSLYIDEPLRLDPRWHRAIESRIGELESGNVKAISGAEVEARIRAMLAK